MYSSFEWKLSVGSWYSWNADLFLSFNRPLSMINMAWSLCEALLPAQRSLVCCDGTSKEDGILPPGVLPARFRDSNTYKERQRQQKKQDKQTNKNLRSGTDWDKLNVLFYSQQGLEQIETSLMYYSTPSRGPQRHKWRQALHRAGLLLIKKCLLRTYYVSGTVPGT